MWAEGSDGNGYAVVAVVAKFVCSLLLRNFGCPGNMVTSKSESRNTLPPKTSVVVVFLKPLPGHFL